MNKLSLLILLRPYCVNYYCPLCIEDGPAREFGKMLGGIFNRMKINGPMTDRKWIQYLASEAVWHTTIF